MVPRPCHCQGRWSSVSARQAASATTRSHTFASQNKHRDTFHRTMLMCSPWSLPETTATNLCISDILIVNPAWAHLRGKATIFRTATIPSIQRWCRHVIYGLFSSNYCFLRDKFDRATVFHTRWKLGRPSFQPLHSLIRVLFAASYAFFIIAVEAIGATEQQWEQREQG